MKLKWLFTFLASGILLSLSSVPIRTAIDIFYIDTYLGVGQSLVTFAYILLLQSFIFIVLAILIPFYVWWNEDA